MSPEKREIQEMHQKNLAVCLELRQFAMDDLEG